MHRIGIVGAGHWSKRLKKGLDPEVFTIHKTVDVLSFDDKRDLLFDLGVSEDRHYRIDEGDPLPTEFFEDIDVVQVASPVEFHLDQTVQALDEGRFTVTEKSYGSDREEFEAALDFMDDSDAWNRSYLHLHYLKKLLTIRMPDVLERAMEEHGPVERVEATFVEEYSREDAERGWLFEPANGGVFLDWIHPLEVLVDATDARFRLRHGEGYRVEPDYSRYPSAAHAVFDVEGTVYGDDAEADVRVGKGFPETRKLMKFVFEDAEVEFRYADSETEFESPYRGEWRWTSDGEVVDSGEPKGEIPYEIMAEELRHAVELGSTPMDEETLRAMYEPVWSFNEHVDLASPVEDPEEVSEFVSDTVDAAESEVLN